MARLIAEDAIEHQYFFTQVMAVDWKLGTWLVTDNGCGFGHFVTLTLEHAPFHARLGTGDPRQVVVVDYNPLVVISVDIHGSHS
jgi:hypothetical protein